MWKGKLFILKGLTRIAVFWPAVNDNSCELENFSVFLNMNLAFNMRQNEFGPVDTPTAAGSC